MANMTHILMASNSAWVVPATTDERRFCVMDVSDIHLQDDEYFDRLNAQMEAGGLAAMLHDLLHHDLSRFNIRQVPQTEALADQKRHSLDSLHRWWLTVLQRGFVWRSRHGHPLFTNWDDFVTTELLHRSYLQWCNETRESWPMNRVQLGGLMKGLYPSGRPRTPYPIYEIEIWDAGPNGENKPAVLAPNQHGYSIGALDAACAAFSDKTKLTFDWDDDVIPDAPDALDALDEGDNYGEDVSEW
jgi:hypothetical protein